MTATTKWYAPSKRERLSLGQVIADNEAITWGGDWNNTSSYPAFSLVAYQGAYWLCTSAVPQGGSFDPAAFKKLVAEQPPIALTAAHQIQPSYAGRTVEVNSATPVTIGVPPSGFGAGKEVRYVQTGAGALTFEGLGPFVLNTPSTLVTAGQWSTVVITFRSASAAVISGGLAAA